MTSAYGTGGGNLGLHRGRGPLGMRHAPIPFDAATNPFQPAIPPIQTGINRPTVDFLPDGNAGGSAIGLWRGDGASYGLIALWFDPHNLPNSTFTFRLTFPNGRPGGDVWIPNPSWNDFITVTQGQVTTVQLQPFFVVGTNPTRLNTDISWGLGNRPNLIAYQFLYWGGWPD